MTEERLPRCASRFVQESARSCARHRSAADEGTVRGSIRGVLPSVCRDMLTRGHRILCNFFIRSGAATKFREAAWMWPWVPSGVPMAPM